jgi:hypothetical protein
MRTLLAIIVIVFAMIVIDLLLLPLSSVLLCVFSVSLHGARLGKFEMR